MIKKAALLLIFLLVICYLIFTNLSVKVSNTDNKLTQIFKEKVIPTPTPFLFSDMTIPHLRSRSYISKLGSLKRHSENSQFTSYTTSYDSDGLKVNGLLTIPKGVGEKWPAIVFVHGYIPPEIYKTEVNYASYVNRLARDGFVVFKIDLRGHGNSEGDPGGAYYSGDYVIDILNAYKALEGSTFVDPNKIGLWGHSMAGNAVLRALAAMPNIPAVVVWAGAGYTYTDLQEYMIQDNSYRPPSEDSERSRKRQLLRDTYGSFDKDHWFWKQVPATNYLDGITGAIQLNHAVDDNVVSVNYSRNLVSILEKTNITHELIEYPTGGHNLVSPSFERAMVNTVSFFKENFVK